MTRQTREPLRRMGLNPGSQPLTIIVGHVRAGRLDLAPAYQRPSVWTEDQRIALVYSWMSGINVPAVTISDRSSPTWKDRATYDIRTTSEGIWACIDGRQRIETAVMWMDGEFAVPASWFLPGAVETVEATSDGPYVRYTGLTSFGQASSTDRTLVLVDTAELPSLRDEARLYSVLNGGGTPQTTADMDNADRVARGG